MTEREVTPTQVRRKVPLFLSVTMATVLLCLLALPSIVSAVPPGMTYDVGSPGGDALQPGGMVNDGWGGAIGRDLQTGRQSSTPMVGGFAALGGMVPTNQMSQRPASDWPMPTGGGTNSGTFSSSNMAGARDGGERPSSSSMAGKSLMDMATETGGGGAGGGGTGGQPSASSFMDMPGPSASSSSGRAGMVLGGSPLDIPGGGFGGGPSPSGMAGGGSPLDTQGGGFGGGPSSSSMAGGSLNAMTGGGAQGSSSNMAGMSLMDMSGPGSSVGAPQPSRRPPPQESSSSASSPFQFGPPPKPGSTTNAATGASSVGGTSHVGGGPQNQLDGASQMGGGPPPVGGGPPPIAVDPMMMAAPVGGGGNYHSNPDHLGPIGLKLPPTTTTREPAPKVGPQSQTAMSNMAGKSLMDLAGGQGGWGPQSTAQRHSQQQQPPAPPPSPPQKGYGQQPHTSASPGAQPTKPTHQQPGGGAQPTKPTHHQPGGGAQPTKPTHHQPGGGAQPTKPPQQQPSGGAPPPPPPPPQQQGSSPQNYQPPPPVTSSTDQLRMSNRFVTGLDKAGEIKQFIPEPDVIGGGMGPLSGLYGSSGKPTTPIPEVKKPCDLRVDAVFALDDMKNLWLARDSIRFYQTQLQPSRHVRFGVVLCGLKKSFYTTLHGHFSALLASLEDLQHANVTLDPATHMADTPGHRSDNNPYPPRVSADFASTDAGCLETCYNLFTYRAIEKTDRVLAVMGTKDRWGSRIVVDEARFLHSVNISILTLADGDLPKYAQECLRNMASSPNRFRSVKDNVTLHALPTMIGNAICRPHKADVTLSVQQTSLGKMEQPVVTACRMLNDTSLERTRDFGRFFGQHTDQVRCVAGLIPDPRLCECV